MTARRRFLSYASLLLVSLAFFLPGQAGLPPVDRDESRYAQSTTQMLETANFIDIRFQDEPRYLQPAGIYWLQAVSVSLLSTPEARAIWAYRVPSLVGATLAVLLTAALGNLLFGAPAGFLAAALMAMSLLLGVEARMAKTDAVLLATILAAQMALARIYLASGAGLKAPVRWAVVFWLALGVGMVVKGPINLLVVFGTILFLTVSERRAGWLRQLRPIWGVPLMLAVVLPWLVAIGISSGGAFFAAALGHSMLGKIATGQQAHGMPPGYYLLLFPVTFWPGSLFAVLAAPFVWAHRREPAVRFCLCWIAPSWIIFELIATKLPHYVLPVYPAIACLAAAGTLAWRPGAFGRWRRWITLVSAALWLVIGAALACSLPAAGWMLEWRVSLLGVLTGIVALMLLGAAVLLLRRDPRKAVIGAGLAALTIFVSAYAVQLPGLRTIWMSPRIADAVARVRPCPQTKLATIPYDEPSLVFLSGVEMLPSDLRGVVRWALLDPSCTLTLIGAQQQAEFLSLMAAAKIEPRPLDHISGIDYSNGKRLELTLYAPASPATPPAK